MAEASKPVIELRGVSKRFGATVALRQIDLCLHGGEIHVVAGENGAGKSTLIRVIAGVHAPDDGQLLLAGRARLFGGPVEALDAGISTIHQELSLVGPMSVCDNLHLGMGGGAWQWLDRRGRHERARAWLAEVGLSLDPAVAVERLPLATRQLVEIARALRRDVRLLILDEPTSALSQHESEQLMDRLEQLRAQGCALLYVSHRSEELERLADRVTVLRDGEVVGHGRAGELSMAAITRLMGAAHEADSHEFAAHGAGSAPPLRDSPADKAAVDEPAALQIDGMVMQSAGRPLLRGVSLIVAAGEIVGLAGLRGSGAQPLLHGLIGARPATFETLRVAGEPLVPSPRAAIAAGMVLLSGDRSQSVLAHMSVLDNAGLSSLARWSPWGWMRVPPLRAAVAPLVQQLSLRAPSLDSPCEQLSGGNQQKVALMRSMLCRPRVLLLDDATRGIDVRAKAQVHRQISELAQQGVGVLMVSSDTQELVQLCSRVLVMVGGAVQRELSGLALSRAAIVTAATEAAA